MTSQENLPVWARILLGIPFDNRTPEEHNDSQSPENENSNSASSTHVEAAEQRVMVFRPATIENTWRSALSLRPALAKLQS